MRRVREGIYQRESGKYVVPIYDPATRKKRWSHPDQPRGGFERLADAQAFKRRVEEEKRKRGLTAETCDSFAGRWVHDYPRPQGTTNRHNGSQIRQFAEDFKGRPLDSIRRPEARAWAMKHPAKHQVVRAMFNDAVNDEIVAKNPFAGLGLPESRGRAEITILDDGELERLVAIAEKVWGGYGEVMVAPMILVAAGTGMRPGELFALRWSWIDFEHDEIAVKRQYSSKDHEERAPKTAAGVRTVLLLPFVRAALQRIPRRTDDEHVFFLQSGKPFQQRSHHYYWDPVRKAFWLQLSEERQLEIDPGFDFYELRHYFGSYLAARGVLPYDIADQMGHKDGGGLAMRRYIKIRSRDARERAREAVTRAESQPRLRRSG